MSLAAQAAPFFLDAGGGERFCLYHPPVGGCRGAFVYVHPFGDEMNRTRRMAALGARALARAGYGVLQIDLAGCGDSSGEFGEARWQAWKDDLALARGWLAGRLGRPAGVWGLRLGALLALDHAADLAASGDEPPHLLLWQPVLAGATYLTQVLRLRMAGDLVGANAGTGGHGADSPQALRALLGGGSAVEIGGYLLAPELAAALDRLDAVHLAPAAAVDWFEVVAAPERPAPPAAQRVAAAWHSAADGKDRAVRLHTVAGPSFWASQEITECPALIAATVAALAETAHA
jgi:exosortase A-associated hydrolase 2